MTTLYDFTAKDITATDVPLSQYRGQVVLVVNTASKCGFTPQYEGLEKLYDDLSGRGLVILGFPCNQFGKQEPGDAEEIKNFCTLKYDVKFPLFAKIDVNGPKADPLYNWLKSEAPGFLGTRAVKWNFTKFLVDKNGAVVARFGPSTTPAAIRAQIEALL